MIQQTRLNFKLEMTSEEITPHSGLPIYAEFLDALGLRALIEKYLPKPGSNPQKDGVTIEALGVGLLTKNKILFS